MASTEIESGELGAIKYLSEITGWDIKKTANFFILTLIFVFDPLAIALVIATNQAFKNIRRKNEGEEEEYPFYDEVEVPESYLAHSTPQVIPQVEPEIIEKIVEVERIVQVPVEVERIVEVPVDRIVEVVREVPVEVVKEVEVPIEIPFKYYVNDNGTIFDDQGNEVDERIFNKKLEEIEKRILTYKK